MPVTERSVWYDGPCLFLMCQESGGHSHPVCGTCGAVRYGNLFCGTCREHHGIPEAPDARD